MSNFLGGAPMWLLRRITRSSEGRAVDSRRCHGLHDNTPYTASRVGTRKRPAKPAPEKISLARLPVTGSDLFGREEDLAFLDRAWANKEVNVVTIVAWAGVGKSTLVNHWLSRMAAKRYRSAELVFGWSLNCGQSGSDLGSNFQRQLHLKPA